MPSNDHTARSAKQADGKAESPTAAPEDGTTPAPATTADDDARLYEPYPGAAFFHGGRHSPIVAAMGRRLEQEACAPPGLRLGPDWTRAHQRAFAAWQHTLRPKGGGDTSGIPDDVAWRALRVPRITPSPAQES
ncbi:peptidoglycan-binding protein [Streptomyces sp. NPDC059740]|uniref:peptidoglycan-binding protein n=1 Tax=Streptomyces sp. NPDC059740 TaxID=3346926 RepID=UPI0036524672